MKSIIAALTLSSAAAAPTRLGAGLRFSKVAVAEPYPCDPSTSVEQYWHPAGKADKDRSTYVKKCDAPRINPNTGEPNAEGPKNPPACQSDAWTILKGGFSVSCQWDKKEKRCRGYGEKADACARNYQAVDDAVFKEKLA